MVVESMLVLLAAGAGGLVIARARRSSFYASLGTRLDGIAASVELDLGTVPERSISTFEHRIVRIADALPQATLEELRRQASNTALRERSYVPAHKKGGTVAYESLFETAPSIVALYHSPQMKALVSRIVGTAVQPTPIHDQSSLSVLLYERPGDHIGWHYDHNFYRGRHFTVLLVVVNEGSGAGLSHATLKAMIGTRETLVAAPPNTLVVFEGARVRHKVTPLLAGERRLVISMTYCTDPRANLLQGAVRRLKDVAFFGPRALWT